MHTSYTKQWDIRKSNIYFLYIYPRFMYQNGPIYTVHTTQCWKHGPPQLSLLDKDWRGQVEHCKCARTQREFYTYPWALKISEAKMKKQNNCNHVMNTIQYSEHLNSTLYSRHKKSDRFETKNIFGYFDKRNTLQIDFSIWRVFENIF